MESVAENLALLLEPGSTSEFRDPGLEVFVRVCYSLRVILFVALGFFGFAAVQGLGYWVYDLRILGLGLGGLSAEASALDLWCKQVGFQVCGSSLKDLRV